MTEPPKEPTKLIKNASKVTASDVVQLYKAVAVTRVFATNCRKQYDPTGFTTTNNDKKKGGGGVSGGEEREIQAM
jgi:hypothetical protein